MKTPKISTFYKKKSTNDSAEQSSMPIKTCNVNVLVEENPPKRLREDRENETEAESFSIEVDPALRKQISKYHVSRHDEIRKAYVEVGPYQPKLENYKKVWSGSQFRKFQMSWFDSFCWLEYSPSKNAAFCFPCYLFAKPSGSGASGYIAFVINGFDSWQKVINGLRCSFLRHEGESHQFAMDAWQDMLNPRKNIQKIIEKFSSEQITNNRLRLKASIDIVRMLTFQASSFRGSDESSGSLNRGNFLELLDLLEEWNEKLKEASNNAPKNATYKSGQIQKEILSIISTMVKKEICKEIGDANFCVIIDESRDQSKREQMAIVLRFVDIEGLVRERFFGVVHVSNTIALTLKKAIFSVLSCHNLDFHKIRGQGYNGASNMRGEFHGLQALVLEECQYAYYVHCFAHRLQLALMASCKEVNLIQVFFIKLALVINLVGASCKRNDELKAAHASDIAYLISIEELETGKGLNQIGSLQRAGDTRWSSHLRSVTSLINMYSAACLVVLNVKEEGTSLQRAEATLGYEALISFEFVFVAHLMKEILGITDHLCQALQCQSQDILNAMRLVSSTKFFLQELRNEKWDYLLDKVTSFCKVRDVDIPNMSNCYVERGGRARKRQNDFTIEHHFKMEIFHATIDSQIQEIDRRFSEKAMELLKLSSSLNPQGPTFCIDNICELVDKFYSGDFSSYEKEILRIELGHYERNVVLHSDYKSLSSIAELCQWLVTTKGSMRYKLVYKVLVLILTLPVSTATTERSFSAMNLIKTSIRNKMEDDYLDDAMVVYIEKRIAKKFTTDEIIDIFEKKGDRRVPFS